VFGDFVFNPHLNIFAVMLMSYVNSLDRVCSMPNQLLWGGCVIQLPHLQCLGGKTPGVCILSLTLANNCDAGCPYFLAILPLRLHNLWSCLEAQDARENTIQAVLYLQGELTLFDLMGSFQYSKPFTLLVIASVPKGNPLSLCFSPLLPTTQNVLPPLKAVYQCFRPIVNQTCLH